jgi:hypothetical protein
MARCPNCGSSVRTGAKFCTTCGFRLPADTAADQGSTTSRSPFDTTSTSTISARWPSAEMEPTADAADSVLAEPPLDETEVVADTPPADVTSTLSETDESPAETAPFTGWPPQGSALSSETDWHHSATDVAGGIEADEDGDHQQAVEEAIASWSSDDGDELVSSSPSPEAASEEEPSAYSWLDINDESETATIDQEESALAPASYEFDADSVETAELSDEPVAPEDLIDVEPVAVSVVEAIDGGPPVAEPLARATQLIDELRELIPRISTGEGHDPSSAIAVAAELERVRGENAPENEAFQSLRAAVATAQARPRDVDIMLDLVSRAGAIADVIAAHDRYQAAIDAAIDDLRGETTEEPTPRW